jgi:hypothetical protein
MFGKSRIYIYIYIYIYIMLLVWNEMIQVGEIKKIHQILVVVE